MDLLINYLLFLLKTVTIVVSALFLFAGIVAVAGGGKDKTKTKHNLRVKNLNEKFDQMRDILSHQTLSGEALKRYKKQLKEEKKIKKKLEKKEANEGQRKIFVLDFKGDIAASAVEKLRREITAILTIADSTKDEVLLCLESPGGTVHGYGLAASQLQRLRDHNIKLTIAIDKVAASGGYMMACVANTLLAAPFAIIGSIGVVAQLPNFNRLLKKNNIDFEQVTAGNYKRTLTMFGENTKEGREKVQEDVVAAHDLFKAFIKHHRPQVDIERVSTGEYWHAAHALEKQLVDQLITSDNYLLQAKDTADIYRIEYKTKTHILERLGLGKIVELPITLA